MRFLLYLQQLYMTSLSQKAHHHLMRTWPMLLANLQMRVLWQREMWALGTASLCIPGGPVVSALAVVNAVGDIWDRGHIVVGALCLDGTFVNQTRVMLNGVPSPLYSLNTTIAVVATTARLTKAEANRVAKLADDGMARAISPNHTQWDGDTVFCLALGSYISNLSSDALVTQVGTAAAVVLEQAIIRGALAAQSKVCPQK
nr:P1 family peptidase [Clostridium sporogenes]